MIHQHKKTASLSSPRSWPQRILSYGTDASSSDPDSKAAQSELKKFVREVKTINLVLQHECRKETVLLLLNSMPCASGQRGQIWEAIRNASHIIWIILTDFPDELSAMLPPNWGDNGYPNVCIAVALHNDPDANRERIHALSRLPALYRALWLGAEADLTFVADLNADIGWIIADSTACSMVGGLPENLLMRAISLSQVCRFHRMALFHNRPDLEQGTPHIKDVDALPEHPFPQDIDLHRPPLSRMENVTKPNGLTKVLPPSEPTRLNTSVGSLSSSASGPVQSTDCQTMITPKKIEFSNLGPGVAVTVTDSVATGFTVDCTPEKPAVKTTGDLADESPTGSKRARFKELDAIIRIGIKACFDAGLAMMEIRKDELWRDADYPSWDAYCASVMGMSRNYANRCIKGAEIMRELSQAKLPVGNDGIPILPLNESQVRPLARLKDPSKRLKAWKLSVKRASGIPAAATVAEVVCELLAEDSPPKPPVPSRKERRTELIAQLRQAAAAKISWESVMAIVTHLEKLA
jgi:hypothetical protein